MFRYNYFRLRFSQWFKNQDGMKAFAQQCMNWIMRSTLRLAKRLQKRNKQLSEKIRELSTELEKRLMYPVIDDDEFATYQKEIRNYTVIEWCIIIAEAFFNFFAARAIFNFEGWLAIAAQVFFALVITWISIPLFRNFFFQLIHDNPYKSIQQEPRNWRKLFLLLLPLTFIYEAGMYNLCKLRGEQIEGGNSGFITTLMIIMGMLLPIVAGYFAYERRKYYSPYINTLRVSKLRSKIAKMENKIQTNIQRMENHFKQRCQELWAVFQEFQTYKENYNRKRSFPEESLADHFCETQKSFVEEAIDRYKKKALDIETSKPTILITPHLNNKLNNKISTLFINPISEKS